MKINSYIPFHSDFRFYEDQADDLRETEEGTLLPLWKFLFEKVSWKKRIFFVTNLKYFFDNLRLASWKWLPSAGTLHTPIFLPLPLDLVSDLMFMLDQMMIILDQMMIILDQMMLMLDHMVLCCIGCICIVGWIYIEFAMLQTTCTSRMNLEWSPSSPWRIPPFRSKLQHAYSGKEGFFRAKNPSFPE